MYVIMQCSNTSSIYSLYFAWLFDAEEITAGKLAGVILCLLGVIIVSFQDLEGSSSDSVKHSIGGDIVAVFGAVLYSLFTTLLKVKVILHISNNSCSFLKIDYFCYVN